MPRFSRFKKPIVDSVVAVAVIHSAIILAGYALIYDFFDYKFVLPNNENLLHFDAYWYFSIKEYGYDYTPGVGNNLAFFPLFSLVWKVTTFSPVLICIFNYIVFLGSFVLLLKNEKLKNHILLLLLSFPSFIFFALPYSESLFFLFSAFIILGYRKKSDLLLCIGFLGASMVRSVCVIFIPAIVICHLFNANIRKTSKQKTVQLTYMLLASVGGLLLTMVYINYKTDTWFYFVKIQKYWNRQWIMPQFPLTTISAKRVLGLDGITFMFGVAAIYVCLKEFVGYITRYFRPLTATHIPIDNSVLFSALYIAGMVILDSFFTCYNKGSTNIWSINRHIMCTPFAITFLVFLYRDFKPNINESVGTIALLISGIFFTGVYQYATFSALFFFLLFFIVFCLFKYSNYAHKYFALYYIIAVFLQISFFGEFLLGLWLG